MWPSAQIEAVAPRRRRGYLDWLRGIAVLVMIEAHLVDSWTAPDWRETREFGWAIILGGLGAPLFLLLAGVAVSLSAGAKARRSGDHRAAAAAVVRRGLEIFGLAFLFRVQAWVLGWSSPRDLLKVDILNIMGPSIMAAAALWGLGRGPRSRGVLLAGATLAVPLLTPILREASVVLALPDPLRAYVRPVPGLSNFVFLPWMAFVFAGAAAGLLLDRARTREGERLVNLGLLSAGVLLSAGAFALSYLPSPYASSWFWTTSPAYFFLRTGLLVAAIGAAYLWESRPGGAARWSPVRQLGETSLFIYWIHVEMIYGLISEPLHRALGPVEVAVALVAFSLFMLLCSLVKERAVTAWAARPWRSGSHPI